MATYLPDDLLAMADRMSMASSLELRVPFCDVKIVEFALSLPSSVKMRGWRMKAFLKDALAPYLPEDVLTRRKQGFMVPMGRWLKEDLRPMAEELLGEAAVRKRGLFDSRAVRALLRAHYDGRENNSDIIWALINLELWHQLCLEGAP
jgi:asparagine synthase (glutamine-hydrolysing)